jgi:hypothetical protein
MRRTLVTMSTLALLMVGASGSNAQPRGVRTTITGEVVDLWCYLEGGDRGPAKKDCATSCARAGNPIGVLDAKGNLYVAAGLKDHQPAQSMLLNKMSDQVTVTGAGQDRQRADDLHRIGEIASRSPQKRVRTESCRRRGDWAATAWSKNGELSVPM